MQHACPGADRACSDESQARKWAEIISRVAFAYAFQCTDGHWHYAGVA